MTAASSGPSEYGEPVFRDKRRIDPETGRVREPQTAAPSPPAGRHAADAPRVESADTPTPAGDLAELEAKLTERTHDLQRLQAEYVNYKRRVDRDREAVKDAAVVNVLAALLPVLDDIGRAREHDELVGGFKAVAESLERIVNGLGLEAFGVVGDQFDPRIHEALMHKYAEDVSEPVAEAVLQVGYRFGDRIVRPARVAVVEPPLPYEVAGADGAAVGEGGEAPAGGAAPGEATAPDDGGAEAAPTGSGGGATDSGGGATQSDGGATDSGGGATQSDGGATDSGGGATQSDGGDTESPAGTPGEGGAEQDHGDEAGPEGQPPKAAY